MAVCQFKGNPADDASRGMRIVDFIHDKRWIEGPQFLNKPEGDWPANVVDIAIEAGDLEVKK